MADLEQLQTALGRELKAGCGNDVVEGGLDEFLVRQAQGEPLGSPLLRMVRALPVEGYRSLDEEQRRTWVRRAIATVVHERVTSAPPKPARKPSGRWASRKPSPPGPLSPRTGRGGDEPGRGSGETQDGGGTPGAGAGRPGSPRSATATRGVSPRAVDVRPHGEDRRHDDR